MLPQHHETSQQSHTREGLETWEELQSRHTHLELRKELKNVEVLAEVEKWELDLNETWQDMKVRLEKSLRCNAMDHEKKPFSGLTVTVTDGETTDGRPTSIVWQSAPSEEEIESTKQNSDHMLSALKLSGLDLPNMALLVHGGSAHPWQLIRVQQMEDQVLLGFLNSGQPFVSVTRASATNRHCALHCVCSYFRVPCVPAA